jgi:hypothetical protein
VINCCAHEQTIHSFGPYDEDFGVWVMMNIKWIIAIAVIGYMLLMVLVLFVFQTYLMLTNQTSYEFNRYQSVWYFQGLSEDNHPNPFGYGAWQNIKDFFAPKADADGFARWRLHPRIMFPIERTPPSWIMSNEYWECC